MQLLAQAVKPILQHATCIKQISNDVIVEDKQWMLFEPSSLLACQHRCLVDMP